MGASYARFRIYFSCTNYSLQHINESRGVVKSNDTLVSKSFGYIDEYTVDGENVSELLENNKKILDNIRSFHQSKIYKMYEGTVVRMFFWTDFRLWFPNP